jgi:hypothetical protein
MSNFTKNNAGGNTPNLDVTGSNSDVQSDIILQESLDTFSQDLGLFGSIHKDFGGQALRFNQNIVTRIWANRSKSDVLDFATGAGGATAQTHSYNDGNESTDAEPVSIALDQHKFIKFHLTDLEREESQISYISDMAKYAGHALARYVAEDLLEEGLANSTYDNQKDVAKASWDIDNLYDLAKEMDDLNMPSDGRWLVMSTEAYYQTLKTMTTITNASYGIAEGIRSANLDSTLAGFQVYTYRGLESLTDSNATGFDLLAGYRGSLAMVNRLPEFADASMQIGDISNASDPNSGISLQLRRKYDVFDAKELYALTIMYGLKAPKDSVANRMIRRKIV